MHRLSLLFSSACSLNPPFSPPLPTNGSGDQGDQLGAGRGAGRAGRMSRLCTLHGLSVSLRPTPRLNILSPCPEGKAAAWSSAVHSSCVHSGSVGDKVGSSVSASSLAHGLFHGCGLLRSWGLWDCCSWKELPGMGGVCIEGMGKRAALTVQEHC